LIIPIRGMKISPPIPDSIP